ncbi:NAD(P)-dependent oxidoreductase [Acuticoccus kandeliae]|uniref:NAD(P)-dependent oxidoreductase n=1 Tax=Acuticoccus kandeliae TaxID=2073160 RepID=UPI000D3E4710|nr:NAD(P)-dependent oxidoreductase [Acuticoccus kandeliae]
MKVLLTHTPTMRASYYGEGPLAALHEIAEVRLHESEAVLEGEAFVRAAEGCDIVLTDRLTTGPAAFFDAAPDPVAFLRCAVDVRNIDIDAASRAGILVTRATPGFVTSVAELTVGFMLDLARGAPDYVAAYRAGSEPAGRMGRQLEGSTLGIIGYGVIGERLAALGLAFGMTILVTDPYKTIDAPGLTQVSFETLLADSDFVVCLAVATEETENLMNAAAFARMRPSAFFINVSRGNLVDEAALAAALDRRAIAGAALDVGRAPDQKPSLALAARPDVMAAPHVGGLTPSAIAHQAYDTVEQVRALVEGRLPDGALNTAAATRLARIGIKT